MPCIKAKNNDILISYFSFDLNIQTKKLKKKTQYKTYINHITHTDCKRNTHTNVDTVQRN